jgi:hypothetical protein
MINEMKKIKIILLCAMSIVGLNAYAQVEDNGFADWDANQDKMLDTNEFNTILSDHDYYNQWDANTDTRIDENEWNTGMTGNYPDFNADTHGRFDDWDMNNDGFLDQDEYSEGTFNLWDEDKDGFINDQEYETWYNDDID